MEEAPKKRFTKKRLIILCAALLSVIAFIAIVSFIVSKLNQPVTNSVTASNGSASSTYYNINLAPVKITGSYVSFNSPKGLPLVSRSIISPISVEDFSFYTKDIYSWTLAIDIIRTPDGQLNQSSSYNLRKDHPEQYSEDVQSINGKQFDVMTDTNFNQGFSKVAYISNGSLIGIISLIGDDSAGTGPLATTFNMVLGSWQWLQ